MQREKSSFLCLKTNLKNINETMSSGDFNNDDEKLAKAFSSIHVSRSGPNHKSNDGWSWNADGKWQRFSIETSKEIDNKIRSLHRNGDDATLSFPLTKGSYFAKSKNKGTYFVTIHLNASRSKIERVYQTNINTQKTRNMKREPQYTLPGAKLLKTPVMLVY